MKKKHQKKQKGTGCSKHFCLDYSLAFFCIPIFWFPYHFKELMTKSINPNVGRISAWRWNPWSITTPTVVLHLETGTLLNIWKKLVSNGSSFTLSYGKCWNTLSNKHIQVGCGISTKYPIYIVCRCGSEIIWPNTFHKNLISKVCCNSTSPFSSLFDPLSYNYHPEKPVTSSLGSLLVVDFQHRHLQVFSKNIPKVPTKSQQERETRFKVPYITWFPEIWLDKSPYLQFHMI